MTSKTLAKGKHIKTNKLDKEEEQLFQKYKMSLRELYPDGDIPKEKVEQFKKNLKLERMRKSLKNDLF